MRHHAWVVSEVAQMLFPVERAATLAGLPAATVSRWVRNGLILMEHRDVHLFSFRDLVALRTLAVLHLKHRIPVRGKRGLRAFSRWLNARYVQPFASLRFSVAGREIIFDDGDGLMSHFPPGQVVAPGTAFDMREVASKLEGKAKLSAGRARETFGRVDAKRKVIAGTRIATAMLARMRAAGMSSREILREYPSLHADDVEAAIRFERGRVAA